MSRARRRSWLRRSLPIVGAGLLALGGLYAYVTRPARLRAEVRQALEFIRFTDCHIGEISFTPWGGLELDGLELSLSQESPLRERLRGPHARGPLRVGYARIVCDRWALLLGKVRPTEIELRDVEVMIIRDAESGATNWVLQPRESEQATRASRMPPQARLRLDNADVRLVRVEQGVPRLVRRWLVDAVGRVNSQPSGLRLELRVDHSDNSGEPRKEPWRAQAMPLAEILWSSAADPAHEAASEDAALALPWIAGGKLDARLDWVDVDTVSMLLPTALADAFADFGLTGRARIERLVAHEDGIDDVRIRFADFGLSIPVEEPDGEGTASPQDRFLRLAGTHGELFTQGNALALEVTGRINDADARLTFTTTPPDSSSWASPRLARQFERIDAWPYEAELEIDGVEFPDYDERRAFVESPRLPHAVRVFFRNYRPRGRANVRMSIASPTDSGDGAWPTVEGDIEPLGGSCRYFRFPYDFEDVRGHLRFTDGALIFDGLHGRHGSARVRGDGRVEHIKPWARLDLTIRAESVPLDSDLYAALPESHQALWRRTAPIGMADVVTTIHRPAGTPETGRQPVDVSIDARLLGGSLSTGDGKRLTDAQGRVAISHGVVTVHEVTGLLDGARMQFDGRIAPRGDDTGHEVDLRIEATDMPFDRSIAVEGWADPERDAGQPPQIRLAGVADVVGRLRNDAAGSRYTVHVRDGVLTAFDDRQPWKDAEGWLTIDGGRRRVVEFAARRDDAWLEANGDLPDATDPGTPVSLTIRAGHPEMDTLARQLLPPRWSHLGTALGLGGEGWVSVLLRPGAPSRGPASEPVRQAAEVRLECARMRPEFTPLDLREAQCHATVYPDGLELHQLTARYGDTGQVRISGTGGWEGGQQWLDLTASGREMEFCDDLIGAMPGPLSELLERMAPTGRIDSTLDHVRMVSKDGQTWQVAGRLALREASAQLGLPLDAVDGELSGTCAVQPDGQFALDGSFFVQRGLLAERAIERFEGQLKREPGQRWVMLDDIRGRLCDGEVIGRCRLDPATGDYELSLTLHDVQLDCFLNRKSDNGSDHGRVQGRVFATGRSGEERTVHGGGELRIHGASLLRSPVLRSVVEARDQEVADRIDRADLRFVWDNDELKFDRIDIQSRDLRLVGEGSWNMRTDQIEMTLLGAHPEHMARIPVLTDLVELAQEELMQYRVSGTSDAPRVAAEPLHNLTDPLRRLLGGR